MISQLNALTQDAALLSQLVEGAPDAVLVIDFEGHIVLVNRQTEVLFGYSREEILGQPVDVLLPERLRPQHVIVRSEFSRHPALRPMGEGRSLLACRKDGTEFPVEVSLAPLEASERAPGQAFCTAVIRDVTTRAEMQAELVRLALHDPLTGLPNRTLGMDRLRGALARNRRRGSEIAVLFVDIDQLKVVNDGLGHDAGDVLIKTVGERMASVVRPSDTVARIGGDEFLVIVEGLCGPSEIAGLTERLLAAARKPLRVAGRDLFPTLSVGVAVSTPSSTGNSIVQEADDAMYRAKHNGRDRVEVFREEWRADMLREIDLRAALGRDVGLGELGVKLQPVVDLRTGRAWGAEVLLRWMSPDGEELPALEVVRLAEQSRLIVALDRLVIRSACRLLTDLATAAPLRVGVNVSGQQLLAEGLPTFVSELMEEFDVAPGSLWLEVTEADHLTGSVEVLEVLAELRALGVPVAIDDFGTGFSSLSRLRDLPVDILKIDGSFISQVDTDARSRAMVAAIIELAHALGLAVIAEGVEHPAQREVLEELGCDFGQGFHWAPALDAADLRSWLSGLAG